MPSLALNCIVGPLGPAVAAGHQSHHSQVNSLLQTAGNLGKAVGVLVHVMTDDEANSDNDISLNDNNTKSK